MKRYLLSLALLCLVATGAHAYWQSRAQVAISGGGGGFVGPLDVQSGALAAFCLRACSAAAIGTNVIDIKRASDSTTQTFISLASGALDVASITTFLTATTGVVTQWYDQTGNGHHATATTGAPPFTLNVSGLGAGNCGVTFNGTSGQWLAIAPFTAAQPFFISTVAIRTSGTSFTGIFSNSASNSPGLLWANAANGVTVFAGSTNTSTVADNTFHSIGALFNGASSQAYINGTGGGVVGAGAANFSSGGTSVHIGDFTGTSMVGSISEAIIYASDVSASAAALSANQRGAGGYNF